MKNKPNNYDHSKIEKKWQKQWEKDGIYKTNDSKSSTKQYYILDMFPYPSGEGLHVGHPKGFIATDTISRMKRMQGFNVLHPMGFDAFGLPAENYAIKTKTNPVQAVAKNVKRYRSQLNILGLDYDWSRQVNTTDPSFYKWTQWAFIKMFKKGLAYESNEPINWCPSCKTGLANEDVEDGKCERCGTIVEKKAIRQWVLKITKYADRLLKDLEALDWPRSIKESQVNWIGRSEGVNLKFKVKDMDMHFEMFDSIPQTFMAQTFTVIAPDHPKVIDLVRGTKYEKEVMEFVEKIKAKKTQGGFDHMKDMEGIFTGRYIEYPPAGRDLPIWIASFVLSDYGSGIVNCSFHDERDYAFAKKYNIPLHPVLFPEDKELAEKVKTTEIFYREPNGILAEPSQFAGRRWDEVRKDIIKYIVDKKWGTVSVQYKLRDWVFSRQRYWGEPFPIVHDENGKAYTVSEKELPVVLPKVKSYEPTGTGESPLAGIKSWVEVYGYINKDGDFETLNKSDKRFKKLAKKFYRETNTMPQWAGSSWYYLRYMDVKNSKALVDPKIQKAWLPVDFYVGGAEHATRHLIYARFWHKFLKDIGVVSTNEPFKKLQNVGLIMGADGRKMSKRFGNVVNPDDMVKTYGADTMRLYTLFIGPFDQAASWQVENMIGVRRFLERVWKLQEKVVSGAGIKIALSNKTEVIFNQTIKKVEDALNGMSHNTAVSQLMICANALEQEEKISQAVYLDFMKVLAPFAPHIAEEIWSKFEQNKQNKKGSIHLSDWPSYNKKKLIDDEITIVVQINSKVRAEIKTKRGQTKEALEMLALNCGYIKEKFPEFKPIKTIIIPDKLVNFVLIS